MLTAQQLRQLRELFRSFGTDFYRSACQLLDVQPADAPSLDLEFCDDEAEKSGERKGNFDKKTNEQINKIKEKEDKEKINDNKQNLDENIINIKPVIQHSIERKRPVFTLPKDKKRPLSEKKSFKIIHKYYDENFILEDDDEENTIK